MTANVDVSVSPNPEPTPEATQQPSTTVDAASTEMPVIDLTGVTESKPETQAKAPEQATAAPQSQVTEEQKTSVDYDNLSLPTISFDTPPHNVVIKKPTTKPGEAPFPDVTVMPAAPLNVQSRLLEGFPNMSDEMSTDMQRWSSTFLESITAMPSNNDLEPALRRDGSEWRQGVEINGDLIRSTTPRFSKPTNATISGEQAIQMAFSHMGIGDFFHAAMWNSGFWVTFKPAPEPVWLAINRLLGADVSRINRETYGLLHSTATSLTISTLISAILPYVYGTSVNASEMKVTDIPQYLSTQDEHDFIWGFIAANYPDGFSIDRSCIADPSKCRAVTTETLNVAEMQVVDNQGLSEFHRNHMRSRGMGTMSIKSVKEYQERLEQALDAVVELKSLTGKVSKVTFRVPLADKKARMADNYVDDIKQSVLATTDKNMPIPQREALYEEMATATEMRMYQHWVKSIEIDSNTIEDEETIASVLGQWTRDYELRKQFFEAVSKFINNSSMSVIGLEAFKCPVCGADHNRPEQKLRERIDYIPIDVVQLFSNLAEFKTRIVQARA